MTQSLVSDNVLSRGFPTWERIVILVLLQLEKEAYKGEGGEILRNPPPPPATLLS